MDQFIVRTTKARALTDDESATTRAQAKDIAVKLGLSFRKGSASVGRPSRQTTWELTWQWRLSWKRRASPCLASSWDGPGFGSTPFRQCSGGRESCDPRNPTEPPKPQIIKSGSKNGFFR
eukprot:6138236-Amphidinium_carterae.1